MHAVLNKTDLLKNSNKFFSIELQESIDGKFRILTNYGRVGNPGVQEGRYFEDRVSAENEYNAILRKKQGKSKGYVLVDVAKAEVGSEQAKAKQATINFSASKIKFNMPMIKRDIHPEVRSLVSRIYEDATGELTNSYNVTIKDGSIRTPLGVLSQKQIDIGKAVMKSIQAALQFKDTPSRTRDLISFSNRYFSAIPRKLPPFPKPEDVAILDQKKADAEEELLILMQDVFDIKGGITDDIDQKYKGLRSSINYLENDSPDFMRIRDFAIETQSNRHGVEIWVNRIYRVKLESDYSRFNPNGLTPIKELFHGSRPSNILGIMSKGLLIAPKNVPSTGYMFGKGIYFANKSTKSTQYASNRFGGGTNKDSFYLFVADVALGKMKEHENSYYYEDAPTGYHSVKGVTGRHLLHDEFIIYNTNQCRIRYVIDFSLKRR